MGNTADISPEIGEETPESRKGVVLMEFSLSTKKAGVDELPVVPLLLAVSTSDSQKVV